MPKISVLIPTHNRATLLPLAIDSVFQQTFQDFEIIIVDDASTDNTADVVSRFRDERVKFIHRDVSGGDAVARNLGLANCQGQYIALLDDDDEWFPEKLEQQINIFRNSGSDIGGVYTGVQYIDGASGSKLYEVIPKEKKGFSNDMLDKNTITTSSLMFKKECIDRVGLFDETFPCASDHDMWIRIAEKFQYKCIPRPLTKYRLHGVRLSLKYDLVNEGKEKVLKKHEQRFKENPKFLSNQYLDIGILYCLTGKTQKGRQAIRRAIRLVPFRLKPYLIFGLSYLGTNLFRKVTEMNNKVNEIKRTR